MGLNKRILSVSVETLDREMALQGVIGSRILERYHVDADIDEINGQFRTRIHHLVSKGGGSKDESVNAD